MNLACKQITLALLISAPTSIHAAQLKDPLSLKGHQLGADVSEISGSTNYRCEESPGGTLGDTVCELAALSMKSLAEAPIDDMILRYYNNKLFGITVVFKEKYFQRVAAAFIEKYGRPIEETMTLTNRFNAIFTGKSYTWKSKRGVMTLSQYQGDIETSQVIVFSHSGEVEYTKREEAERKRSAGDL